MHIYMSPPLVGVSIVALLNTSILQSACLLNMHHNTWPGPLMRTISGAIYWWTSHQLVHCITWASYNQLVPCHVTCHHSQQPACSACTTPHEPASGTTPSNALSGDIYQSVSVAGTQSPPSPVILCLCSTPYTSLDPGLPPTTADTLLPNWWG